MFLVIFIHFRRQAYPIKEVVVQSFLDLHFDQLDVFFLSQNFYFAGIWGNDEFTVVLLLEVHQVGDPDFVHDDISSLNRKIYFGAIEFVFQSA